MRQATDHKGKRLGMWLFLYTEIILFGGLFVLYAVYLARYPVDFIAGGKDLNRLFGAANTLILLVSSCAVASSITAVQKEQKKTSLFLVGATIFCGLVFLINKYFEWGHKVHEGIYPGSESLTYGEPGRNIFFGLYYVITGLHGIHILIGMTVLTVALVLMARQRITSRNHVFLENAGLYWHLVDLAWIFIFPLFYLVL
ncbi:cytochrome c oxidase subunit 3 family protein [Desulfoluna spongiiphila]|uniref:Cytochrome c oxidase subunit 3 n=1 Tax=Desulfoluna spongiiphila TaxID=419481 RepID=A0A1G5H395_9BACT|nr:cytochrome c oxidase subunit 3 family protein [Desulfoluna spongiiphila]SCY58029.1 cytochrome c oxidase subunit 3 [Desulfoluna spongiiphila]VVS94749.1 cytochrome c oxidase subunit iii 4-helical bundle [Desulfoluna spongiiphila]